MNGFVLRLRFWRDHRWAPDQMSAYLDGELPVQRRGRMERHVGVCRECRATVASLRLVIDALHRLPAPEGGAGAEQIATAVRTRLKQPSES